MGISYFRQTGKAKYSGSQKSEVCPMPYALCPSGTSFFWKGYMFIVHFIAVSTWEVSKSRMLFLFFSCKPFMRLQQLVQPEILQKS